MPKFDLYIQYLIKSFLNSQPQTQNTTTSISFPISNIIEFNVQTFVKFLLNVLLRMFQI